MKIRASFSFPFNNWSKNCRWREATCSSTTKYALSTFLKGREIERERRKERMEWAQYIIRSEKDHFVPSVRKEIANSMLAGIFISPSSVGCSVPGYSTWENKRYTRSTARSFAPKYYFLNLFFSNAVADSHFRNPWPIGRLNRFYILSSPDSSAARNSAAREREREKLFDKRSSLSTSVRLLDPLSDSRLTNEQHLPEASTTITFNPSV